MLRKVSQLLFACLCLSCFASAQQDFSETVIPLSVWKLHGVGIQGSLGTGFCIDPECRFIGTAYHVAALAKPRKIKGQQVIQEQLATGPDDEGVTSNDVPSFGRMKYNLSRDLGIFELRHPLPHHHGAGFDLDDLELGQEVDIYSYPGNTINPIRTLQRFRGFFKGETQSGLLAFEYNLSGDKTIRPGASGGIVIDAKTRQIVGILTATASDGELVALAVPVQSLADFMRKVQPWVAQKIFPIKEGISPVAQDFYPKFVAPSSGVLEQRPEELVEIKTLRNRAQLLAESMLNFISVETLEWGQGEREPFAEAAYEVRVIDGDQKFREYPEGKKELSSIPFPPANTVMVPAGEWSWLPKMVGTELGLKIHQASDATVNGERVHVFQYSAAIEDGVCKWKSVLDLMFMTISTTATVSCYGEVWTDQDFNILRISEHDELPGKWKDYRAAVNYGWLRRKNESSRLIPVTVSTQVMSPKGKIYWCRGQFTNYQIFTADVKIGKTLPETLSKVQSSREPIQNDHR